jgi:hypothetical protein
MPPAEASMQRRRKHRVRCSTRSADGILSTVVVHRFPPRLGPGEKHSNGKAKGVVSVYHEATGQASHCSSASIYRLVKIQSARSRYLASYSSPVGDMSPVTYTVVSDVVDRWRPCKPVPGVCVSDNAQSRTHATDLLSKGAACLAGTCMEGSLS